MNGHGSGSTGFSLWFPGLRPGQILFRMLVILSAILGLALRGTEVARIPLGEAALLLGLIFLSRSVPVALSREKPITFTAAFVFASSILLNGAAAGVCALLVCVLHARYLQRGGRPYSLYLGAQYALASLASYKVFVALAGPVYLVQRPTLSEFGYVCVAAGVFIAVNGLLVALGNLGTRYARREHAEPVLMAQALAYVVSFPFAIMMIVGYHAFGLAALPSLAAVLLVCAHAVRMTIENKLLGRQIWAMDALGRTCAAGVRTEMPLNRFLSLARELVAFDRAVLWLADDSASELRAHAVFPRLQPPAELPSSDEAGPDTLLVRTCQRSEPILVSDASADPRQPAGGPSEAWILYPLLLQGKAIGVAQFARSCTRPFTRSELKRLSALVPQATVAFESVRVRHLMHRFADMAITDGLTGLLNHRRSQEVLRDEMARATRYRRSFSLLMVDVDSFKLFNDTYGHPQGDLLLKNIARILRDAVRNVDHVGRYGGEEFIVMLPETNRSDAQVLAERIRVAIASAWFVAGEDQAVQKTVSIGLASYPEDGIHANELLQQADDALYRAKRTGKNKVLTA